MEAKLKALYKRPSKLSDPYHDFTPGMLSDLLSKKDEEFRWYDYSDLFGPHLPAGTYEEVIYFLPQAFSYLIAHEDNALDLVIPIFGFCSKNIEKLENDGLANEVKLSIMQCLKYWVKDFRIIYFDKDACLKKGWGVDYKDLVVGSEVICEAITGLVRFKTLKDIAVEFIKLLAYQNDDVIKSSWFLELSRARFDVYRPSENPVIYELLVNENLLDNAYATVWSEAMDQKISPTYWRDTFNQLGI